MTITKPRVTKIIPRFKSNIKQHIPLIFGQNGFGAAIASMVIPAFLDPLDFVVLATEGDMTLLALRYE